MVIGLAQIALGLVIVYSGVSEIFKWLRARRRLLRTTAVIVGKDDGRVAPGHRGRAAVFEFTTPEGHVVQAVSSATTFPEPKVGARITVSYDPTDPYHTAERPGVRAIKIVLSPALIGLGVFVVWLGTRYF